MFINHESDVQTKLDIVASIFHNIKETYSEMIMNAKWLDADSLSAIMKKISWLKSYFGFPFWIRDDEVLLEYYENVRVIYIISFCEKETTKTTVFVISENLRKDLKYYYYNSNFFNITLKNLNFSEIIIIFKIQNLQIFFNFKQKC